LLLYGAAERDLPDCIGTFPVTKAAIVLSIKYSFQKIESRLRKNLLEKYLAVHPLEIYWFSCLHGFMDEKKRAARSSIHLDPLVDGKCEEIKGASAIDFQNLLGYHRACMKALDKLREAPFPSWFGLGRAGYSLIDDGHNAEPRIHFTREDHWGNGVTTSAGDVAPKWTKECITFVLGEKGSSPATALDPEGSTEVILKHYLPHLAETLAIQMRASSLDIVTKEAVQKLPIFIRDYIFQRIQKELASIRGFRVQPERHPFLNILLALSPASTNSSS
jgi:hypothetical protein